MPPIQPGTPKNINLISGKYNKFGSVTTVKNQLKPDIQMTKDGSIIIKRSALNSANQVYSGQQPNTNTFAQIADAIGMLNQTLASTLASTTQTTGSSQASNYKQTSQPASVGGGSVSNNGASYSGYAQGLSSESSSSVNTGTLKRLAEEIQSNGGSMPSIDSALKNDLAQESAKINQSLAQAQADYNSLASQKMTAEANVTRLQSAVSTAETERNNAKTNLDNNKSSLNSSIQARDTLDEQLGSVNDQYKNDCDEVKTQEQNKSSAQQEVSSAKSSKSQAQAAVTSAEQSLQSAESALAGTPETLEDGKPNPQYATAKAAVEQAKSQKQQAEKSLEQAEQALNEAQQKLDSANDSLEKAQTAKQSTLDSLKETDSKYKDMAEKCEKMQDTVEQNQESYDNSLETYDDVNGNYERLNSELETQQGILTQYEAMESKVNSLKQSAETVKNLESQLNEKIKANMQAEKRNGKYLTDEEKVNIENDIINNSQTEGCSADKTPLENLISCKDADLARVANASVLTEGTHIAGKSAQDLERDGYIKNNDGSFTDPRTGVTIVNFTGDNYHWSATNALTSDGEVQEYYNHNLAGRDWPGAVAAANRAKAQSNVVLTGFDTSGKPTFRWKD